MTVVKLLTNNNFLRFCYAYVGLQSNDLLDASVEYLYDLMVYWYNAPIELTRLVGVERVEVFNAIIDGSCE